MKVSITFTHNRVNPNAAHKDTILHTSFGTHLVQDAKAALTTTDWIATLDYILGATIATAIFNSSHGNGNTGRCARRCRSRCCAACCRHGRCVYKSLFFQPIVLLRVVDMKSISTKGHKWGGREKASSLDDDRCCNKKLCGVGILDLSIFQVSIFKGLVAQDWIFQKVHLTLKATSSTMWFCPIDGTLLLVRGSVVLAGLLQEADVM
jgi:hypothetical protein